MNIDWSDQAKQKCIAIGVALDQMNREFFLLHREIIDGLDLKINH